MISRKAAAMPIRGPGAVLYSSLLIGLFLGFTRILPSGWTGFALGLIVYIAIIALDQALQRRNQARNGKQQKLVKHQSLPGLLAIITIGSLGLAVTVLAEQAWAGGIMTALTLTAIYDYWSRRNVFA